ncbi:MAG TPA: homoserine O-succinyltransferase [Hypericibacter adhaerens]|uniref:Homoserine O-acetyltransferase n=1 Tax=Hypericibacter adhaerens TaxID=2602016 RepID=A0A5J6N6R1_9PROT|nr:homoserine O-succinyltransferase [Hypericibacter adhaerens]QEX24350.1 homoserine O-succinyltransferase [Hypericibacter adhaerens]HWA44771.1 homoserine O-succinyltransferase [Hypericibacter adhaerens]
MSIVLPEGLPAGAVLAEEGFEVRWAPRSDGRTLRIGLLNLMPDKLATELQFARLLASGPREIELLLTVPATHQPRNTAACHLGAFYRPWQSVARQGLDGLIVTGAPVEQMPFEAVDYWPELCRILDWARLQVRSGYYVCWGAQAALYRFHGIGKRVLPAKLSGLYGHHVTAPESPLAAGLPARFVVPVSRHTESCIDGAAGTSSLVTVLASAESGPCLVEDAGNRAVCVFNHFEYDADTLAREYRRDLAAGEAPSVPVNYFPGNDPDATPIKSWHFAAAALFENWLASLDRVPRARPAAATRLESPLSA